MIELPGDMVYRELSALQALLVPSPSDESALALHLDVWARSCMRAHNRVCSMLLLRK